MGSAISAEDLVVLDTESRLATGEFGSGASAVAGATLAIRRATMSGNRESGLYASNGGQITGEDVTVERTRGIERDGSYGRGANIELGSGLELDRARFVENREFGLFAIDAGTTVTLRDVEMTDTQPSMADGTFGRGLNVEGGAVAAIERGVFERQIEAAIYVDDPGTTLTAIDIAVRDTRPRDSDGATGRGLNVQEGASVVVSRALFERNRESTILVDGEGSVIELSDLVVLDSEPPSERADTGRGVGLQNGARASMARAVVGAAAEVGIVALHPGTSLELADVVVRDSSGRPGSGFFGRGLVLQSSARATAERIRIRNTREVGVFVMGSSVLEGTDVVIDETLERACATTTCADAPFGSALVAVEAGQIAFTDFVISRAALCGVLVARGADVRLTDGEVASSTIGACVQDDAFDITHITTSVRYRDNQVNLDTTALPLPDAAVEVAPP